MMQTRVVSDNGLRATDEGFVIDVRLPWYRSLPLSVVDVKKIEIDGEEIDRSGIRFDLNNEVLSLTDLRPRTEDWWYVLDSALLRVADTRVKRGESYKVAVTVAVRPPYINGLNRIVRTEKTLVAQ